jgi:hypothetical protein
MPHRPMPRRLRNPITSLSYGGFSARLFVGRKVGTRTRWSIEDIINVTVEVRRSQKANPGSTYVSQQGVYFDSKNRRIIEPSVQVIIIDMDDTAEEPFVRQMAQLGDVLRHALQQEAVIIEVLYGDRTRMVLSAQGPGQPIRIDDAETVRQIHEIVASAPQLVL